MTIDSFFYLIISRNFYGVRKSIGLMLLYFSAFGVCTLILFVTIVRYSIRSLQHIPLYSTSVVKLVLKFSSTTKCIKIDFLTRCLVRTVQTKYRQHAIKIKAMKDNKNIMYMSVQIKYRHTVLLLRRRRCQNILRG